MDKVETVFDHNVTDDELKAVTGAEFTKEQYLSVSLSQDSEYCALYRLFSLRNDTEKASIYFNKIKNEELRASITEINEGII